MKKNFLISISFIFIFQLFVFATKDDKKEKQTKVEITTSYGKIKLVLYNETPLHRDNFTKLVKEGFFDSLLFHRVIKEFMIQGGDPSSKNAKPGAILGNGGPGYNIPAEIDSNLFHFKGVLAAARQPDAVNPKKESSGSQFYIVQGKVYTKDELNGMAFSINRDRKNKLLNNMFMRPEYTEQRNKYIQYQNEKNNEGLQNILQEMTLAMEIEYVKQKPFKFSPAQIEKYTTVGGTPFLDGEYTVFGEVIEGFEVIDAIASVNADNNNRPIENIIMKIKIL